MLPLLNASVAYITNHLISHIPSYRVRHAWYHRVLGWYIGPGAAILMGLHVYMRHARRSGRRVSIGLGSVVGHDCLLSTTGGLLIGDHIWISPGVWLITGMRDINDPRFTETYRPIVIDDYAWIGPRAMILGGVTIGRGAIVQAGAVVTSNVEPNSVVAGIPARVVGTRNLRNPSYALNHRPLFE